MLNKNDKVIVEIIDNGMNFEGIAKIDGYVIFVPFAIKGEKVEIVIIKANKKFAIGKVLNLVNKSKYRVKPDCKIYGKCGSCNTLHINYDYELEVKKNNLITTFKKQGIDINNVDVIGMGNVYNYRNKVSYPVREINGVSKIGFFRSNSHDIVLNEACHIQNENIDILAKKVFDKLISLKFTMYNEESHRGDIRHIILKRGYNTHEILLALVLNNDKIINDKRFKELASLDSNIKSINVNINMNNTNEILGSKTINIYGDEYITEILGDKLYYISTTSFFQVNTVGAEMLYFKLKEMLELNKKDILFDLYSGVGSIGIFLSDDVAKVYGIEIVKEAVDMAGLNLKRNNITNCEYVAGSVEDKIVEFQKRNIKPSVIVVDPPRRGLDSDSINYILNFNPDKIGYVSCNISTLARDIKLLQEKYEIKSVSMIDLFPNTHHSESVCVLERR